MELHQKEPERDGTMGHRSNGVLGVLTLAVVLATGGCTEEYAGVEERQAAFTETDALADEDSDQYAEILGYDPVYPSDRYALYGGSADDEAGGWELDYFNDDYYAGSEAYGYRDYWYDGDDFDGGYVDGDEDRYWEIMEPSTYELEPFDERENFHTDDWYELDDELSEWYEENG